MVLVRIRDRYGEKSYRYFRGRHRDRRKKAGFKDCYLRLNASAVEGSSPPAET